MSETVTIFILENIRKNDAQYRHLPHVIRKARAMEFILKNTKAIPSSIIIPLTADAIFVILPYAALTENITV